MLSLTAFNVRFTPKWSMTFLTIVLLLLFSRLGVWQLDRAAEKKQMLRANEEQSNLQPQFWTDEQEWPIPYQPLIVSGYFLPEIFLLDNQHEQHQFGYHVISPLLLNNSHILLVDRGWVAGDPSRQQLPLVANPPAMQRIQGTAYFPSAKVWHLGQWMDKQESKKSVIELLDTHLISQFLHKSVYPFIIRLDAHEANGYVRKWEVVAMPPERHYAYAAQWFAMAATLLVLWIVLNVKKIS